MDKTNKNNALNITQMQFYVCDGVLDGGDECFPKIQTTTYTGISVNQLLEKFLGENLNNLPKSEYKIWCASCLEKIDSYDHALLTAKQVEQELIDLLLTKIQNSQKILITQNYKEEGSIDDIQEKYFVTSQIEELGEEEQDVYEKLNKDELYTNVEFLSNKRRGRPRKEAYENNAKPKLPKFKDKSMLKQHLKTQVEAPNERQICDICGQAYKSKSALDVHVGLHNGFSPYECQVCGRKFTQKGALVRHMPIHTGERPYQVNLLFIF